MPASAASCAIGREDDATAGPARTAAAGGPVFGDVAVGPHERALVRALARFPLVVLEAVERRGPHRVHAYLGELAAEFHVFYRHCRVLTDDPEVAAFRSGSVSAPRGRRSRGDSDCSACSAPERM